MVPTGYLRLFQPLEAFRPEERRRWERYIDEGGLPASVPTRYVQRVTTGRLGVLAPASGEHADLRVVDGEWYVCPWRTRLRVLAGLLGFREAKPIELADQFVPAAEAKRASKELARMRRRNPDAVSFIHESPWHVPVRWFLLFRDEEKRLVERPEGGWHLRYATLQRRATRRAQDAYPVLRRAELGPIADNVLELHEWLTQFDPRSLLELDYDGLCDLMTWDELDDDHSAREIHEAMTTLAAGEYPRAADQYQRVLGRWAEVRSREQFN
ncbi:MAG: hypothetical protein WD556_08810 [Actinomycetota bacterium]